MLQIIGNSLEKCNHLLVLYGGSQMYLYKSKRILYYMSMTYNSENPHDLGLLMGPEQLIVPDVVSMGVPLGLDATHAIQIGVDRHLFPRGELLVCIGGGVIGMTLSDQENRPLLLQVEDYSSL